tara:strand:- start:931 stop:3588 length:2658 start_codon:yes stop_codon:yes gene_type:complete
MVFVTVPPKPKKEDDDSLIKNLKEAVNKANREAAIGVRDFVEQKASKSSQILINAIQLRCGTDMCLTKDIAFKDWRCEDQSDEDCLSVDKCSLPTNLRCADKCTYDNSKPLNDNCSNLLTRAECTEPGCMWKRNEGETEATCKSVAHKTDEPTCNEKEGCIYAQMTRKGTTTGICISDFIKTAKRGCFARCNDPMTQEDYDCINFQLKEDEMKEEEVDGEMVMAKSGVKKCPANTRQLNVDDTREIKMCKLWYKDNVVTEEMVEKMIENYNCKGDNCENNPITEDSVAETECQTNVCIDEKKSGFDSVISNIYAEDGTVLGCPKICYDKDMNIVDCSSDKKVDDKQYWPFATRPDGYKFDQSICDTVCKTSNTEESCSSEKGCTWKDNACHPDLIFSGNLVIAGKGDKGMCVLRNIDQENQAEQAQEVLNKSLSAVNLRTIRNSMTDIGRSVAQSGFSFGSKSDVQNLSKNIMTAARDIRSRAAQTCGGGTQLLRNDFMKRCQNMSQNGRALPCIMDETNQKNQAKAAGSCMQNVFIKTDVIQKSVDSVRAQATSYTHGLSIPKIPGLATLLSNNPREAAKTINVILLLVLFAGVSVASVLSIMIKRKGKTPKKSIVKTVGYSLMGVTLIFAIIGFMFKTTQKPKPEIDFNTFLGLNRLPEDGKMREYMGTISDVKEACLQDKSCKAFVFKSSTTEPAFCGLPTCDPKKCLEEKNCDECCESHCTPIMSDGMLNASPDTENCAVKPQDRCKEPCMWAGSSTDGKCINAKAAWGSTAKEKTPDRMWCMSCPEAKGVGTLYKSINLENIEDYDKKGNPRTKPLSNSELACFNMVENTMGIKVISETNPWVGDGNRLFLLGSIGLGLAIIIIMISGFIKPGKGGKKGR